MCNSGCGGSGARLSQRTVGVQKRIDGVEKKVDVTIATETGILVLKPTVLLPFRFKLTGEISRNYQLPRYYAIETTVSEQPTELIKFLLSNQYAELVDTAETKKANEPIVEAVAEAIIEAIEEPVVEEPVATEEVVATPTKTSRKKAAGV